MSGAGNPIRRGLGLARSTLSVARAAAAAALVVVSSAVGLLFSALHVHHTGRYLAVLALVTILVLFLLDSKKREVDGILDNIDAALTSPRQRPNNPGQRVSRFGEHDIESGAIDSPTGGLVPTSSRAGRAAVRALFEKAADAVLSPIQAGSVAVPSVLALLSLVLFWTGHSALGSIVLAVALLGLAGGQLTLCAVRSLVLHEFDRIADQVDRSLRGDNPVQGNETTSLL
jgi:hypothetical protein